MGRLTSARCDAMLRDNASLFRHMWSSESWGRMAASRPACWERRRDAPTVRLALQEFFDATLRGAHCTSDWYEGHANLPNVSRGAALLGFDDSLILHCRKTVAASAVLRERQRRDELACYAARYEDVRAAHCAGGSLASCQWGDVENHYHRIGQHSRCRKTKEPRCCHHAHVCRRANLNILNLLAQRVPYNLCRNLEWQVCAARGLLPGQGGAKIRLSFPPARLDPEGERPLGQCRGWHPDRLPAGGLYGFTNDDIYYLEVCLYNHMCTNGRELFRMGADDDFVCRFSPTRFAALQVILTAPVTRRSIGCALRRKGPLQTGASSQRKLPSAVGASRPKRSTGSRRGLGRGLIQQRGQGRGRTSGASQRLTGRGPATSLASSPVPTCAECWHINSGRKGDCSAVLGCTSVLCDFCTNGYS